MNRTQIDVVMEDDAMMIGEVVAIGYGSQRKEDLSMAVTTVKVDDAARSRASDLGYPPPGPHAGCHDHAVRRPDARRLRSPSAAAARRATTGPPSAVTTVPPRGDGVLVVVDGVPNAPYMVEDIETITVLKDAASAAIYGASVGSSGVVLITTRQGRGLQDCASMSTSRSVSNAR